MKFQHKKEISEDTLEEVRNIFKGLQTGDERAVSSGFPLEFVTVLNRHSKIKANPDEVLEKWYNKTAEEEDKGELPSTRYKDFARQSVEGVEVEANLTLLDREVVKRNFVVDSGHWTNIIETLFDPDSSKEIIAESNYDRNGTFLNFSCTSTSGDDRNDLVVESTGAEWVNSQDDDIAEKDFPDRLKEAIQSFRDAEMTSAVPQGTLAALYNIVLAHQTTARLALRPG